MDRKENSREVPEWHFVTCVLCDAIGGNTGEKTTSFITPAAITTMEEETEGEFVWLLR